MADNLIKEAVLHKLNFFPLGNADCCRIDLENGRKLLFDYASVGNPDDPDDRRIDLAEALRDELKKAKRTDYDVVAFTHLDRDHIAGSSEFFFLQHAEKYQKGDRIKIGELWVPAAVITEEDCKDEAAVIQAEARYRLKCKKGIRVFSRPEALKSWLKKEGIELDEVRDLITDAGQLIPGFTLADDGVEFFTHSPFAKRQNENEVEDRNLDSLVVHATFTVDGSETRLILGSDVDHEVIADIVDITRSKKREERLEWDVFKLPHHCSYTALGPEKGEKETEPVENVRRLIEEHGHDGGILISTSDPIPNENTDQPPHRQAAAYYRRVVVRGKNGVFQTTMEHPKPSAPEPTVIKIDRDGATIEKVIEGAAAAIVSQAAPRAG